MLQMRGVVDSGGGGGLWRGVAITAGKVRGAAAQGRGGAEEVGGRGGACLALRVCVAGSKRSRHFSLEWIALWLDQKSLF